MRCKKIDDKTFVYEKCTIRLSDEVYELYKEKSGHPLTSIDIRGYIRAYINTFGIKNVEEKMLNSYLEKKIKEEMAKMTVFSLDYINALFNS